MEEGRCKGMALEIFFPVSEIPGRSGHVGPDPRAAAACAECPVRAECYQHALTNELEGFWAGTTATARKRIRRREGIYLSKASYSAGSSRYGVT